MRHLKFWVLSFVTGCCSGWLLAVTWQRVRPKTAQEQVAECIERLKAPDWETRLSAADALQKLGRYAAPAVPALTEALKDKRGGLCGHAVFALGNIGAAAAPAAPAIAEHLRDNDAWFPPEANAVLSEMGPDAYRAAPRLTGLLKDSKADTRELAAHSLSRIGIAAASAAPALAEALTDTDNEVRVNADSALIRLATDVRDSPRFLKGSEAKEVAAQWLKIRIRSRAASSRNRADANMSAETLAAAARLGQALQQEQ